MCRGLKKNPGPAATQAVEAWQRGVLPLLRGSVRTELASQFPQWEETEKGPEKEKGHPHEGPRRAGNPSPQAQVCARQKGSPTPTPVMDYRCFQNLGRMFGFPIGNVFTFISPTGSPLDLVSSRIPSDGSPTSWTSHQWGEGTRTCT